MGLIFYRELPPERVAADRRRAAMSAASFAALDLEMPPVRVRWFEPGTALDLDDILAGLHWFDRPHPVDGVAFASSRGDEVWVAASLPPARIAWTVLHEALHAFQYRRMGHSITDAEHAAWEAQARQYTSDLAGVATTIGDLRDA